MTNIVEKKKREIDNNLFLLSFNRITKEECEAANKLLKRSIDHILNRERGENK